MKIQVLGFCYVVLRCPIKTLLWFFLTVDRFYLSVMYFIHTDLHLLYTFMVLYLQFKKHDIHIKYIVYVLCRCAWVGVFSKWKKLFHMQLILHSSNSKVRLNILNSLCLQISSYVHYAKNWYFKDLSQSIEGPCYTIFLSDVKCYVDRMIFLNLFLIMVLEYLTIFISCIKVECEFPVL